MIVDRYYYHQLNRQDQAIYRAFYDGVMAHKDIIPIPVKGRFPEAAFSRIFLAMTRDNPLIYYLNQSACNCARDIFGHYAICPQYFFPKDKIKEYNRKIEKEVNQLAGQLRLTEGTDYEKELRVHDWMCKHISYDYEGSDTNKPVRMIVSHNIIGVFAHRKAQCEGIAKAVKVLLNAVDVKCIVVAGDSMIKGKKVPHAWNLVNVEGQPYHLDVTWDLGVNGAARPVTYDYYNVTDQMICNDHIADTSLPECTSLKYNYFTVNKRNFRIKKLLFIWLERELRSGQREFYFRIDGKRQASVIIGEALPLLSGWISEQGIAVSRIERRANDATGTCWIKIS